MNNLDQIAAEAARETLNVKVWELYLFPGGLVGHCKHRWQAILWCYVRLFVVAEKRAINTQTGEHIVVL